MSLLPNTKLGPYEIIASIGAGGMGEVYRARDSRLSRDVAIKVLPASFAQDAERLRRFEQEARSVAALSHPNILAIFDVGNYQGQPYLVSELLEGEDLRAHAANALPQRKAIEYAMQIARGLAAAHEKGIVHRDLKPDNVFVLNDGRIKILDFGLAKLVREEALSAAASDSQTLDHAQSATTPGQVMGTVGYMSPEQVRGQQADHRSDIFAFGAILYEMVSGKRAFKRDSSVETMTAILKEEPEELQEILPNLTPGLDRVVRHCLEKNPAQRFQSASDIAFDLETLSSQSGTGARLKAVSEQNKSYWKLATASVVGVLALASAYFIGRGNTVQQQSPRFHQLTFQRGFISGAKFAPDGQSILYSASWNGEQKPQVYSTRSDALMSRAIDLHDSSVIGISSKGELAILQRPKPGIVARGMLAVVPLTGGAPRELLDDVLHVSWAPDGESVAVAHFVNPDWQLEFPIGKVIYKSNTGAVSDLAVSPNGKYIAFFDHPSAGDTRGFVAVVDLSGNKKILTKEWSDLTGLAWARSSEEIWFTGSDSGINSALYAVNLKSQLRDLLHIPGRLHLFDIGADGKVLLTNEVNREQVYVRGPYQEKEIDLSWFDWTLARNISSDGQTVVLEEDGEGGGTDYSVFLRKTDGSPAIRLGSGSGGGISADGKWVISIPVRQPAPLMLLPTGAGQPIQVSHDDLFHFPQANFMPDGKSLVFTAAEPGKVPRTYTQSIDGSAARSVGPEGFRGTLVSPDGKWLVGRKDSKPWIWNLQGGENLIPLPFVSEGEVISGWSADSTSLFVSDVSTIPVKVYQVDIKTGHRQLNHQHAPPDLSGINGLGPGLITPDGKHYIYTFSRALSDLYVVEGIK